MNKLIYLVYLILPVLLFFRAKVSLKGWNEGFLSLEQAKALQGFLIICVMLHHIGQKTCAPWLWPPSRIIHGLDLFVPIGYLLVAVFFFFNGYGVYKRFHTRENYLKGYISHRILPGVLALYSTTIIFLAARFLLGEKISTPLFFFYLTSLKLCNPNTWYIIVLPFFYLAFYLAFRFIAKKTGPGPGDPVRRDGLAVAAVCLFVLLYMVLCTFVDHNNWWIRGEWWYNCVHLFPAGILFARFEQPILRHVKKHYFLWLIVVLASVYPLFRLSEYTGNVFSYYGENWGAPDKVFRRMVCLGSQMLTCLSFVFSLLLLGMKIRIGNRFLQFMGTLTLEFYLIHGLFVELFDHQFDGGAASPWPIRNVFLYVMAVFACSVPAAWLLKKFHGLILSRFR